MSRSLASNLCFTALNSILKEELHKTVSTIVDKNFNPAALLMHKAEIVNEIVDRNFELCMRVL